MKAAVVQLKAGLNKKENIAKAVSLVRKAICNKAELILLPEAFSYRGPLDSPSQKKQAKESIPGESTTPFLSLAKENKVNILVGSVCESINASAKAYNTSILIDSKGKIKAKYRKKNLFDANLKTRKIRETRNFLPGQKLTTASIGKIKIGLSICFDLRFPEMYEQYAKKGAHVFCVPSNFTKITGKAHWETLLRARAIESFCYVLAPNQHGKDSRGNEAYGNSMIINPWGEVVARAAGNKDAVLYANISLKEVRRARALIPQKAKSI